MAAQDEIREDRIRKRDMLEAAGMNPYTATTNRTPHYCESTRRLRGSF